MESRTYTFLLLGVVATLALSVASAKPLSNEEETALVNDVRAKSSRIRYLGSVDGKCLFLDPTKMNWQAAKALCQDTGLELVKITSTAQHNFLASNLPVDSYWTAARNGYTDAQLVWDDTQGIPVTRYGREPGRSGIYMAGSFHVYSDSSTTHYDLDPLTRAWPVLCEAPGRKG